MEVTLKSLWDRVELEPGLLVSHSWEVPKALECETGFDSLLIRTV